MVINMVSGVLLSIIFILYFISISETEYFFMQLFIVTYMVFFLLYISLSFPDKYQSNYLPKGKKEVSRWDGFQRYLYHYYGYGMDFAGVPSFDAYLSHALALDILQDTNVSDASSWLQVEHSTLANSQWQDTEELYDYLYDIGKQCGYDDKRNYIPSSDSG